MSKTYRVVRYFDGYPEYTMCKCDTIEKARSKRKSTMTKIIAHISVIIYWWTVMRNLVVKLIELNDYGHI